MSLFETFKQKRALAIKGVSARVTLQTSSRDVTSQSQDLKTQVAFPVTVQL